MADQPAEASEVEAGSGESPPSAPPPPAEEAPAGVAEASGTPNMIPGFGELEPAEQLLRLEQCARGRGCVGFAGLLITYDRETVAYTYEDVDGNGLCRVEALALLEAAAAEAARS